MLHALCHCIAQCSHCTSYPSTVYRRHPSRDPRPRGSSTGPGRERATSVSPRQWGPVLWLDPCGCLSSAIYLDHGSRDDGSPDRDPGHAGTSGLRSRRSRGGCSHADGFDHSRRHSTLRRSSRRLVAVVAVFYA